MIKTLFRFNSENFSNYYFKLHKHFINILRSCHKFQLQINIFCYVLLLIYFSDLAVTINQQAYVNDISSHLVTFKVHTVQLSLTQQTFNTKINLLLGSISCYQTRQDKIIDIISSHNIDGNQGLFKVEFIQVSNKSKLLFYLVNTNVSQVDSKSPDLHSVYKSCETSLNLNFAVLNIILHQEGLLSIIAFATALQDEITHIMENKKTDRVAYAGRRLSSISESKLPSGTTKGDQILKCTYILQIFITMFCSST